MTSPNESVEDSQPGAAPAFGAAATRRHYELDALRAFAMLLGIGLHAAIPFVAWRGDTDPANAALDAFLAFVHGFRMPLFFIVSGFFTAMLWRRFGLRRLLKHRLRRIGLPLAICLVTILPAVWVGFGAMLVISGDLTLDELLSDDSVGGYEQQLEEEVEADARPDTARERAAQADEPQQEEFGLAHLWFLWVLLWQVAGFTLCAWLVQRRARRKPPQPAGGTSKAAARLIWALPALTLLPQLAMARGSFGPDTTESLLPAGHVLVYYACFFGFGALIHARPARDGGLLIDTIGRRWPYHLLLAVIVLFPLGLGLAEPSWTLSSMLQVGFAWSMSLGLIGLFRRFASRASFRVRFVSDASYWMYLVHLPLIFPMQGMMALVKLPAAAEFAIVCASVTVVSLVAYRYLVRYTLVGLLLNGRRTRAGDRELRLRAREALHGNGPSAAL